MTEIEKKALALVNEVRDGRGYYPLLESFSRNSAETEALCRAIEKHEADKAAHAATVEGILNSHEAFRQKVSDAVKSYLSGSRSSCILDRFIIAKPDPLADAWIEATGNTVGMEPLNEALAKRGFKIVETSDER